MATGDIDIGEDFQCAVCLTLLRDSVQTICKHRFCDDCLTKWLEQEQTCPICRQRVMKAERTPDYDQQVIDYVLGLDDFRALLKQEGLIVKLAKKPEPKLPSKDLDIEDLAARLNGPIQLVPEQMYAFPPMGISADNIYLPFLREQAHNAQQRIAAAVAGTAQPIHVHRQPVPFQRQDRPWPFTTQPPPGFSMMPTMALTRDQQAPAQQEARNLVNPPQYHTEPVPLPNNQQVPPSPAQVQAMEAMIRRRRELLGQDNTEEVPMDVTPPNRPIPNLRQPPPLQRAPQPQPSSTMSSTSSQAPRTFVYGFPNPYLSATSSYQAPAGYPTSGTNTTSSSSSSSNNVIIHPIRQVSSQQGVNRIRRPDVSRASTNRQRPNPAELPGGPAGPPTLLSYQLMNLPATQSNNNNNNNNAFSHVTVHNNGYISNYSQSNNNNNNNNQHVASVSGRRALAQLPVAEVITISDDSSPSSNSSQESAPIPAPNSSTSGQQQHPLAQQQQLPVGQQQLPVAQQQQQQASGTEPCATFSIQSINYWQ